MSKYIVVVDFTDKDNKIVYRAGEPFPRSNQKVTDERLKQLSTKDNKRGKVFIELNEEEKKKVADEKAKSKADTKAKDTKKEQPKNKK